MKRTIVLSIALVSVLLFSGIAMAEKDSGTEKLEWGDSIYIPIDTGGDTVDVEWEVTVTEGASVNCYYTNQDGKDDYYDDTKMQFSYVPANSVQNTKSASKSFRETEGGTWYLIIENGDMGAIGENSTFNYEVSWEPMTAGDWAVSIGIFLVIIIVIVLVVVLIRRAKKKVTDQPVPPPMDQQPGYDTQQGYDEVPPRPTHLPPSDQGPGYVPPEPSAPPPQQPGAYDPSQKPP